jgi:hypothetical protein
VEATQIAGSQVLEYVPVAASQARELLGLAVAFRGAIGRRALFDVGEHLPVGEFPSVGVGVTRAGDRRYASWALQGGRHGLRSHRRMT